MSIRVEILNSDGSHLRWTRPKEIETMLLTGEVERFSSRRALMPKYRIVETEKEEIKRDARTGMPRVALGSKIRTISLDSFPSKVQGGLCNGV